MAAEAALCHHHLDAGLAQAPHRVGRGFVVGEVDEASLLAHCRGRLAPYEVPREVRAIEAIPKNAVGKPLRRELRTLVR